MERYRTVEDVTSSTEAERLSEALERKAIPLRVEIIRNPDPAGELHPLYRLHVPESMLARAREALGKRHFPH